MIPYLTPEQITQIIIASISVFTSVTVALIAMRGKADTKQVDDLRRDLVTEHDKVTLLSSELEKCKSDMERKLEENLSLMRQALGLTKPKE